MKQPLHNAYGRSLSLGLQGPVRETLTNRQSSPEMIQSFFSRTLRIPGTFSHISRTHIYLFYATLTM
jgi:hypothetical protein